MSYKLLKVSPFVEYKLRLTMQGVITLEDTLNKGIYTIINELACGMLSIETLMEILKQALMPYGYVKCDNDVYNIYDDLINEGFALSDIYTIMIIIFKHAGFFNNGSEENKENTETEQDTYPKEEGENPDPMDKCFTYSLRDRAIECGMSEKDFWNSTFGEITRYVKVYNQKYIEAKKTELKLAHFNADLICYSVGRLLSKEAEFPDICDMYPSLFKEELERREEYRKIKEQEDIKENLMNLIKAFKPKEKEENIIMEGEYLDNGEEQ